MSGVAQRLPDAVWSCQCPAYLPAEWCEKNRVKLHSGQSTHPWAKTWQDSDGAIMLCCAVLTTSATFLLVVALWSYSRATVWTATSMLFCFRFLLLKVMGARLHILHATILHAHERPRGA